MLKTVLIAAVASLVIAVALDGKPPGVTEGDEAGKLALEEIADRFATVYREARYIRLEGSAVIEESAMFRVGKRLDYVQESSHDSMYFIIMRDDAIYQAGSLHEGRAQEFAPDHPKRLVITYDNESHGGFPAPVYGQELDCIAGFATGFLIGPRSDLRPLYSERIREGRLLEREIIDGRSCFPVEWHRTFQDQSTPEPRESSITFIYFIDAEDFLLRRIDRKQVEQRGDAPPVVERWRADYTVQELDSTERQIDWDIWPRVRDKVAPFRKADEIASD